MHEHFLGFCKVTVAVIGQVALSIPFNSAESSSASVSREAPHPGSSVFVDIIRMHVSQETDADRPFLSTYTCSASQPEGNPSKQETRAVYDVTKISCAMYPVCCN